MTQSGGRRVLAADDLDDLAYGEDGLVPVVAQDVASGAVLMVAWANRDALDRSFQSGELHFWSRSRQELWRKGETSGNVLALDGLLLDCDRDTVLALVRPAGPACHTGETTCFGSPRSFDRPRSLESLAATLQDRARERPEGSYTVSLLDDANLRVKKLGEETAELVAALATADTTRVVEESADLVYHLAVALVAAGLDWSDVESELARRAGA